MTLAQAFATSNRKQLTFDNLTSLGITAKQIRTAVENDELCKGVTGYWLPRQADPGAAAVMQAAIRSRNYAAYQGA